MPTEFVVFMIKSFTSYVMYYEFLKFIYLISLLKVIRTRTMLIYMNRAGEVSLILLLARPKTISVFLQLFHVNEIMLNSFKYCFISFLMIHWCGCIQFIVPSYYYGQNIPPESWIVKREVHSNKTPIFKKYVECLFKASSQLFCK